MIFQQPARGYLIGRLTAILFGLFWASNAFLMVGCPPAWFRWARRLGIQGALSEEKYSGRAAIEVRALGAVCLGGFVWVIYDLFLSH
jgi:hypothetical protein